MKTGDPIESLTRQRINVIWDITVSPQHLYKGREKIVMGIAINRQGSVVGLGTKLSRLCFLSIYLSTCLPNLL